MDTLKAANRKGSDDGQRSFKKTLAGSPPASPAEARALGFERKPTMALTMTGRDTISAAMKTFGHQAEPNQIVSRGAMATIA
jgi:hypothetical protein